MTAADSLRTDLVRSAAAEWTKRLVTLDGRNRMLYFRELTRGTLELTPHHDPVSAPEVERLLSGEPVRLSDLFVPAAVAEAARRVRAIAAKARSNFEEKGLATMYLAHSFATWRRSDARVPRAPVVMIPVQISVEGPGGDDAILKVAGPIEANLPLLYAIREELGSDPYPDADERTDDYRDWLNHFREACADIPGFSLDDRLFLANLEFSKLPIVLDMEQHLDMLVANDVVAAIAGDAEARAELSRDPGIDADLADRTHPRDEFLVCDADASQTDAVAAAMRGRSLVIHGPPGTGKSQTIANLISSLAASGKSVLFVAQKRAAISAVTRRLDEAGCGELVLDLHDGSRRRDVARSLGSSIDAIGHLLENVTVAPFDQLVAARQPLVAHRQHMHLVREPYGLTFSALQAMLGTPDAEATGLRLAGDVLEEWTAPTRAEVRGLLAEWRGLAERLDIDPSGIWSGALIHTADDAARAAADVTELVETLIPDVEEAHRATLEAMSLPTATDVAPGRFAEVVATMREVLTRYELPFAENAAEIAQMLAPAERPSLGRLAARVFDRNYRKCTKQLKEYCRIVEPDPLTALQYARRANAAQEAWAEWFPDQTMYLRLDSGTALGDALEAYRQVRDRLISLVPALAAVDGFDEESRIVRAMFEHVQLADVKGESSRIVSRINELGIGPILQGSVADHRDDTDLAALAMRVFAASAIDSITWQEPELAMFDGVRHQRYAEEFASLDKRHLHLTANRVMRSVAERAAATMSEQTRESAVVRHEAEITSHHMPARALLSRAPRVVKALRPCWAMSPLLVSQLLPATPNLFDVVIFDEASQVLPLDAIPSIARGAQVVVAGDPHQLPPSQFLASESWEDLADQSSGAVDATVDSESILDVLRGLLIERKLQWHYRSQDERLINFSNARTYDQSLVSFPGTNQGTGVNHVLVKGLPDTTEDTSSNPQVVDRVVELILEHARTHPEESLGVIGIGLRHVNGITEALRVTRSEIGDDFAGFFEEKGAEPFFIKGMDQAQGDERDHIILSLGYGRNPEGEMVYRWGALTRRGGERRLNVAVTRAKRRVTFVSSISSKEIDGAKTRSQGVRLLAKYLEYAERGGEPAPGRDSTGPMTLFEVSVRDRLQAAGIPLQPHYGIGNLRVDFAAFDGAAMRRPVLAIETDGVGYNSANTARDRDRLRLEVLHKRGWRYHRIWSRDWFQDPDGETAKVLAAWRLAVDESKDPTLRQHDRSLPADRPVVTGRGRSPIKVTGAGILDYSRAELVQLIEWIQSDGVTRTEDETLAEAGEALGFTESGGRTARALRAAIREANR